jgi:hypothetical protein
MRIPTLARRSLTLALTAALVAPSLAATTPLTGAPRAIVAFGDSTLAGSDQPGAIVASAPVLSPAGIDNLDRETANHLLATIDASSLPLSADQAMRLTALLEKGTPVLLHMDVVTPESMDLVSKFFGIAPAEGDVILRKERRTTTVFAPSQEDAGDTADLLSALAGSELSKLATPSTPSSGSGGTMDNGPAPLLPARRFDVNLVDSQGEISGTAAIEVVRSRSNSTDNKMVTITSKTTAKPKLTGIIDGSKTNGNLWSAKLAHEYRTTHTLTAGAQVTYLDYFPLTDGRTDFTQTDTENRGFNIGGSTGSEISQTGKPDDLLAAKLPFNLSFGYEHKWQSSLSTTFKDYSMEAVPKGQDSVQWTAFIAPSLRNILVKHWGSGLPTLVDDKLTPMMRSATLPAMSYWKVPGAFEGSATVSLSGGYTLESQEWWYVRSSLKYEKKNVRRDASKTFTIDMSDPYVSAEITVLIRSATGSGACLRDKGGLVDTAACQASDRSQMWGLDAASRYVNRQSGRCLSVQPATQSVVTVACDNITYEKQWQWRADRLHSMIDHGRYRLYVEGGVVHYAAADGRFADFPVNPFGAPLEPWTNYPSAPRVGVDYIPAPLGSKLEPVPSGYAQFPAVSDDQRWHIQVLRTGL